MKSKKVDVRIFVSYAHRDPPFFRDTLVSLLRWPGVSVTVWTDEKVEPGSVPDKQIRAALEEMHIFVALITPYFAASNYIQEVEVPAAKRRKKKDGVLIAPVVVNHPGENECGWLLGLERLPDKQKSWTDIRLECAAAKGEYDMALRPLRDGVKKLVDRVRGCP
jgi:hypothetical protein